MALPLPRPTSEELEQRLEFLAKMSMNYLTLAVAFCGLDPWSVRQEQCVNEIFTAWEQRQDLNTDRKAEYEFLVEARIKAV